MATESYAVKCEMTSPVCQGDIFQNVKYHYFLDEDNDSVRIVELEFPLAIVISQACDTIAMSKFIEDGRGKLAKFMPSILMCPIYKVGEAKTGEHIKELFDELNLEIETEGGNTPIFHKDDLKVADRDWHYRIHSLTILDKLNKKILLQDSVLDYKHYFSVPMSYLVSHKTNRLYRLDDLFAEQVTLKFCTYLSRVAIPDD